jgi:hypothetical protein
MVAAKRPLLFQHRLDGTEQINESVVPVGIVRQLALCLKTGQRLLFLIYGGRSKVAFFDPAMSPGETRKND